jgi:hypothetical protein
MQLCAIETTDLEQRLAKLEKFLAETTVEAEEHLNGKARAPEDLANSARENAFSVSDAPEPTTKEVAKW